MKKLLLLFTLALLACFSFAAVANYTFGYSTGTYSEITGGTVLGTCTVGGSGVTSLDNVTYFNTPLPFYFGFNGRRYNQIGVNSNGYLIIGGTVAFGESGQINATTVADGAIVGYGKDNQGIVIDGNLGEIRYQTLGDLPNRIFVIQWKNFRDYGATGDLLNYQIQLYEGTNVIKFVYGSVSVVNSDSPQVGLRGTTNADFFNRTSTTGWDVSTAGTLATAAMTVSTTIYPATGTTYTFTPDAAVGAPNLATLVSPADAAPAVFTSGTLNWADGGGWTTGFKLFFAPTASYPPETPIDLGYVTSYDPPGDLNYTTGYSWKVVPYNGFGDNTGGATWTFTTAGAPLTGTLIIGTVPPYAYTTFTAAIAALNGAGVGTGGVTFEVQNGTYNESPPAITVSGTALNPIKFQAAPGANPVVTPAGGTGTFGFKLTDADYVTFDNIDVTGPNTLIYGYWLAGGVGGATNNTIKNCTITVPYGSTTNYGIYSLGVTGGANSNCTFLSNNVVTPYNGIYVTGSSTAGNEAANVNIQGNTLSGIRNYGVYLGYGVNNVVQYNNIGFYAGGTTAYYGIYVFGSASTYNVHHNVISGGYTSSTVYALYNSSGTTTWADNEVTNLYNTSSSGWYGMYATGNPTTWTDNNIHGIANTGTAAVYTAYITTSDHQFNGNTLYDIATGGTSLYGFYVIGGTTHRIFGNEVYNLRYTGTAAGVVYGIHLGSGTTTYVYNNMVYDLRAAGSTAVATAPAIRAISITSGTTHNVWGNSVYLKATGTGANFTTAALYISTTSTTMVIDLKNNIFVNESIPGSTGRAVAFFRAAAAGVGILSAASDKNIYFTTDPPTATNPMGYFYATSTTWTTYVTLGEYQAMAAPKDAGSYYEDVPFESTDEPYNIHIRGGNPTRVEGNALVVTRNPGYDFDNEPRSATTPDIGADEGDFEAIAGIPGVVTLVSPADDSIGLNPNGLTVSWSAPATGGTPTEYYVFVSPSFVDIDDFFGNAVSQTVAVPALSLNLDNITELDLGFGATWYWAVQAHNASGDSDPYDPAFQVWNFSTSNQMQASNTLNIGNIWPEIERAGTIAVTNLGTAAITVVPDGSPEFRFDEASYIVAGSSTYNLPYTFTSPATLGAYTGSVTLTQSAPLPGSEIAIAVTANITTDTTVGNGTVEVALPVDPYFGYNYSQTIYYPSELSWPAGYRIEKIYYYYNGYETAEVTKAFKIWLGHTSTATFASTTSWLPISAMTMVYDAENIPQQLTDGYWMEFTLQTPFVYNGVDNLVIAVDENFTGYETTNAFFVGTATTGVNRSLGHRADSVNCDPAAPVAGTLYAFIPNTKFLVGPVPTNPVMSVSPESWDYGTQVINTTTDRVFTITNSGSGTLLINNITYAGDAAYQLMGLPTFPVSLTTAQTTTFTVRYAPTAAGTQTGTVTINDSRSLTDVALTAVCVDPRITSLPHSQNFDGVTAPAFPLGWTGYKSNVGMTVNTSTTTPQSIPNNVYMYNSSYTTDVVRVISPQVTVPMTSIRLSFYARSTTAGYILKVGTVSAIDGTGVFTELGSYVLTTTHTSYTVSLASYVGTDQYLCFQHGQGGTYRGVYFDTVQLDELMPNDLAATALTGTTLGQAGTPMTFNVTVYNNGTAPQISYIVHLKRYGDDRLASVPVSVPLDPGASAVQEIIWTPALAGNYSLVGEVELTGDGNATNNESAQKAVSVLPLGIYVPVVGDPIGTTTANTLPTNMYWKNGVTETIYTATELQMTAGAIQGMAYFNSFTQNLLGKQMKIWVKNTTATDLTTAWLPFDGYQLVFDGTLDFPIGANTIYVPFSTPLVYTGGNLAIRVNRVLDTDYFLSTNVFYYTVPQYGLGRSRYIQSDSTIYDPLDPGLIGAGTLIDNIPVTAFMVAGAVPVVLSEPVVTPTTVGTNVILNWPAVPGAYAYRIYGSPNNTDPWTLLGVVWTNSYTHAMGTANMQFFYVEAVSSYRGIDGEINLQPAPVVGDANGTSQRGIVTGFTDNKD